MRTARRDSDLNPGELFSPWAFGGNIYVCEGYDSRTRRIDYRLEKKVEEGIPDYIHADSTVYVIHRKGRIKHTHTSQHLRKSLGRRK